MQAFFEFLDSGVFLALQIIGGILSVVLGGGAVFLIKKGGAPQRHLSHLWIAWRKGPLPKAKIARQWQAVKRAIESEDPKAWRYAIAEADRMLDEILRKIGYEGDTTDERLSSIPTTRQFPALEDAWRAHQVHQFLGEDPHYPLTREVAERTVEIYRHIFEQTGIIV